MCRRVCAYDKYIGRVEGESGAYSVFNLWLRLIRKKPLFLFFPFFEGRHLALKRTVKIFSPLRSPGGAPTVPGFIKISSVSPVKKKKKKEEGRKCSRGAAGLAGDGVCVWGGRKKIKQRA